MKTNLHCLASSCSYNDSGYCYAAYIKIDGHDATESSETNCDTFREKSHTLTASLKENNITTSQNITCSAKNCTYNLYGLCNASHVFINKKSNKCDSFRLKH